MLAPCYMGFVGFLNEDAMLYNFKVTLKPASGFIEWLKSQAISWCVDTIHHYDFDKHIDLKENLKDLCDLALTLSSERKEHVLKLIEGKDTSCQVAPKSLCVLNTLGLFSSLPFPTNYLMLQTIASTFSVNLMI